jgi:hypothetical protein
MALNVLPVCVLDQMLIWKLVLFAAQAVPKLLSENGMSTEERCALD